MIVSPSARVSLSLNPTDTLLPPYTTSLVRYCARQCFTEPTTTRNLRSLWLLALPNLVFVTPDLRFCRHPLGTFVWRSGIWFCHGPTREINGLSPIKERSSMWPVGRPLKEYPTNAWRIQIRGMGSCDHERIALHGKLRSILSKERRTTHSLRKGHDYNKMEDCLGTYSHSFIQLGSQLKNIPNSWNTKYIGWTTWQSRVALLLCIWPTFGI